MGGQDDPSDAGIFSSNVAQMPRSKSEKERQANVRLGSDHSSEYNNPCLKEEKLVQQCLTSGKHKSQCAVLIENYKTCKEFWYRVRKDRKARGIKPYLPWPEEREAIREEYLIKWNMYHKSISEGKDNTVNKRS